MEELKNAKMAKEVGKNLKNKEDTIDLEDKSLGLILVDLLDRLGIILDCNYRTESIFKYESK